MVYEKGISVIIPVYNAERYLSICLDSLLNQTFIDLEIICVLDKKSSDGSDKIMKKLAEKDSRIKLFYDTTGYGQGYNRNLGLQHVTKEFIGFVDADDYIDEDYYERLYDAAKTFDADVVMGETIEILSEISKVDTYNKNPFTVLDSMEDYLRLNTEAVCWDKLYRTEFIKENNFSFPEKVIYEDTPFLIYMLRKCRKLVSISGNTYYYYIKNDKSTCFNEDYQTKRLKDQEEVMNIILDYIEENSINTELAKQIIIYTFPRLMEFAQTDKEAKHRCLQRILKYLEIDEFESKLLKYLDSRNTRKSTGKTALNLCSWKEYTQEYYKDRFDGISIVFPVENCDEKTENALKSVLEQTCKNLELVCVVDNSLKCNLEEVINRYSHSGIKVRIVGVDTKFSNTGYYNLGLQNSEKSYVNFMSSDCLLDKDFYADLYQAVNVFSADSAVAQPEDVKTETEGKVKDTLSVEYTLKRIYSLLESDSFSKMIFNKNILSENNISFVEGYRYSEHLFTLKTLSKSNKLVFVPEVKHYHQQDSDSDTASEQDIKDSNTVINLVCDALKGMDISLEVKSVILETHLKFYGMKALCTPQYMNALSEKINDTITE